jgi:predicted RNase H-like nuclease (RuvC/YqgF family)
MSDETGLKEQGKQAILNMMEEIKTIVCSDIWHDIVSIDELSDVTWHLDRVIAILQGRPILQDIRKIENNPNLSEKTKVLLLKRLINIDMEDRIYELENIIQEMKERIKNLENERDSKTNGV